MKAVLLDRDGTINREVYSFREARQLRLLPRVAEAIRQLNQLNFLVIVISNQAVVARGWLSERDVEKINAELIKRLAKKGAKIDAIYFCPHHPQAKLQKYRVNCQCRKPKIGLIKKAVKDFRIDLGESFFIGDRTVDILTGRRAGVKTILVKTGYGGKDNLHNTVPDATAKNLSQAAAIIEKWPEK